MAMTQSTMLVLLQSMTDESDPAVLTAYLEQAADEILNRMYPFKNIDGMAVPARYHRVQVDIAAYHLNKRGAEGELNHIENGITRMYESGDTPPSLLRVITPMAAVLGASSEEATNEDPEA